MPAEWLFNAVIIEADAPNFSSDGIHLSWQAMCLRNVVEVGSITLFAQSFHHIQNALKRGRDYSLDASMLAPLCRQCGAGLEIGCCITSLGRPGSTSLYRSHIVVQSKFFFSDLAISDCEMLFKVTLSHCMQIAGSASPSSIAMILPCLPMRFVPKIGITDSRFDLD